LALRAVLDSSLNIKNLFSEPGMNHVSSVALPRPSRYADLARILELGNNIDKDRRNKSRNYNLTYVSRRLRVLSEYVLSFST